MQGTVAAFRERDSTVKVEYADGGFKRFSLTAFRRSQVTSASLGPVRLSAAVELGAG